MLVDEESPSVEEGAEGVEGDECDEGDEGDEVSSGVVDMLFFALAGR